jgi:hypothetical protein
MGLLPESYRAALDSFGIASAVLVALLAAIAIAGFWEFVLQEIKLTRANRKRRAAAIATQKISIYPPHRDGDH